MFNVMSPDAMRLVGFARCLLFVAALHLSAGQEWNAFPSFDLPNVAGEGKNMLNGAVGQSRIRNMNMTFICASQTTKDLCSTLSGCAWCYPGSSSKPEGNGTVYACLKKQECWRLHPLGSGCELQVNESLCAKGYLIGSGQPTAGGACSWCSIQERCVNAKDKDTVCVNKTISSFPYFTSAELTGVSLAISGNLIISISLIIMKKVHMDYVSKNRNRGTGKEIPITASPLWWFGTALMGAGEVGNSLAYAYAPNTIVAPLGAVSVISNCIFAHYYLGEHIHLQNILGVALAISGAVVIVLYAPSSDQELTMDLLEEYMSEPSFIVFVCAIVIALAALFYSTMRNKKHNMVVYILICSLSGCLTVMCIKGATTALILTFQGKNQFDHLMPFVLVVAMVGTLLMQVKYLNLAMKHFEASKVVPVYYVLFTLASIIGGIVLYKEFDEHCPTDNPKCYYSLYFLFGCLVTSTGVYLITFDEKRSGKKPNVDPSDTEGLQQMIEDGDTELEENPGRSTG